jgi:hypothetical protein
VVLGEDSPAFHFSFLPQKAKKLPFQSGLFCRTCVIIYGGFGRLIKRRLKNQDSRTRMNDCVAELAPET